MEAIESIGRYRDPLRRLAARSAFAWDSQMRVPVNTGRFERLFDLVKEARNDSMHQGAAATSVTTHYLDLALILEDALLTGTRQVQDFMVTSPVEAKLFEPLG